MPAHPDEETAELEQWLERLREGDGEARAGLIHHACQRLEKLTRRMFRVFPSLSRWEQTNDVLQNALIRLHKALAEVRPKSPRHFYNLAALEIRRELLDLTKHHFGPQGAAANHHTDGGDQRDDPAGSTAEPADVYGEPSSLDAWTNFHEHVERMPDEEREVFGLLWHQGLSQEESAAVLGVTVRTIKRRWQRARIFLYKALDGHPPV